MLKDLLKIKKNNEKILDSVADGYVDIKIYEYNKEKTDKKLVYHDTGDNTVTDWMRQTIVRLLSGYPLSKQGCSEHTYTNIQNSVDEVTLKNITTWDSANHQPEQNRDGCTFGTTGAKYKYKDTISENNDLLAYTFDEDKKTWKYPVYPTKVLLGTGIEYQNWEDLRNELTDERYYDLVEQYGLGEGEEKAKEVFNKLCNSNLNLYSATINKQGVYSGKGKPVKTITINTSDDNTSSDTFESETPADMSKMYGVRGAVKTIYLPGLNFKDPIKEGSDVSDQSSSFLNPVISNSGKLLKTQYRGAGLPCFIYFNRGNPGSSENTLDWGKQAAKVALSKDSGDNCLNKITFTTVMPSQDTGEYYPYNGYTLRQIGLFNDSLLEITDGVLNTELSNNMPFGTLLAIKNIASFTKNADQEVVFTWTLTI